MWPSRQQLFKPCAYPAPSLLSHVPCMAEVQHACRSPRYQSLWPTDSSLPDLDVLEQHSQVQAPYDCQASGPSPPCLTLTFLNSTPSCSAAWELASDEAAGDSITLMQATVHGTHNGVIRLASAR